MARTKGIRKNKVFGENHHLWKGGKTTNSYGYVKSTCPDHPRADRDGYAFEHILVAERTLGKLLPIGAEIHHFDEDKGNNHPSNLVVCQDATYHDLLHIRKKSYEATGHADRRWCYLCQQWKEYPDFDKRRDFYRTECKSCRKEKHEKNRQAKGKPINTRTMLTREQHQQIRNLYIPLKFGSKKIAKHLSIPLSTVQYTLRSNHLGL
jgi:hypothetical protein